MATQSNGGKFAIALIILIVAGAAAFGYMHQAKDMAPAPAPAATSPAAATPATQADTAALLAPQPSDIIVGDANALVTIVEYSSLSCPHCAHFHETVLPELQKEFITTGKAKLVIRPFPLNDPALKAAELVECAGAGGGQRSNFVKVLFDMQPQWAFNEGYLAQLKQIALVGGVDSAAFDSCMKDKDLEARIVATREEAADKLGVNSTPTFFINSKKLDGVPELDSFRKAINDAMAAK